jgi:cell division protein FtsW (lipid II flippase)
VSRMSLRARPSTSERVSTALRLTNYAWITIAAAAALTILGIYSIDIAEALKPAPDGMLSTNASKQTVFMLIGLGGAVGVALPPYRWLGYLSPLLMIVMVGLLIFLLIPSVPEFIVKPRNGARGWINLGVADFQPAELAKIVWVLVIARYMRYRHTHRRLGGLLPLAVITGVPVALITLQPDLGTAILFVPALFAILVAAGARIKHMALILVLAMAAAPAVYPLLLPHQKSRIVGLFKSIEGDKASGQDVNYQAYTARTLAAAGGVHGVGDDRSRVLLHFNRLPERHNDMIFSVIVNRFGLIGGLLTLGLYLAWVSGALLAAASTRDPFGRLVVVGLTAFIVTQVLINVGMNLGLLPIVGITLPFVSSGGSSLVTGWLMVGIIFNIAVRRPRPPVRDSFEYADDND